MSLIFLHYLAIVTASYMYMWHAVMCSICRPHRSLVVHWNQLSNAWRARKVEYVATWWVSALTSQHERLSHLIQTWGSIKSAYQRLLLRTWLSQKSWRHSTLTGEFCSCELRSRQLWLKLLTLPLVAVSVVVTASLVISDDFKLFVGLITDVLICLPYWIDFNC